MSLCFKSSRCCQLWFSLLTYVAVGVLYFVGKRPKKGMATAKQRLGKILKLNRNGHARFFVWRSCGCGHYSLRRLVLGCGSLELPRAPLKQFACTVGNTAWRTKWTWCCIFTVPHPLSNNHFGPGGERKKEGRTLKRDLELERVSCQGLNFILLLVVFWFIFSDRVKNYQ